MLSANECFKTFLGSMTCSGKKKKKYSSAFTYLNLVINIVHFCSFMGVDVPLLPFIS